MGTKGDGKAGLRTNLDPEGLGKEGGLDLSPWEKGNHNDLRVNFP